MLAVGVLLTLTGFVTGGPVPATAAVRILGAAPAAMFGVAGRLAQRNAMRSPRRTGATAVALMIGMSVVTFAGVVTTSLTRSVDSQVDRSIGADYAVMTRHGVLPRPAVAAVRAVPGLRHVTEQKEVKAVILTPDGQRTTTRVRACSLSVLHDLRLPVTAGTPEGAFTGGISVDADFADDHHLALGSRLTVTYVGGRAQSLPVALITTVGSGLFNGAFYTGLPTYTSVVPEVEQPGPRMLFAQVSPGTDETRTMAALKRAVTPYPQLTVQDQAGYKKSVREQIGAVLYLVYALLSLAITIAVLGVVNTLALSVVERTREIGLLRAIGLSRRQLRRMIRLESVVITLFGALLGTGLGLAWAICTCRVLATKGLDRISIPVTTITSILAASVLVGLVAALGPAYRTGRMHVLSTAGTD